MGPLSAYIGQPATCITGKLVKTVTNKRKPPVGCVSSYSGDLALWNGTKFTFKSVTQEHDSSIHCMKRSNYSDWLKTRGLKTAILSLIRRWIIIPLQSTMSPLPCNYTVIHQIVQFNSDQAGQTVQSLALNGKKVTQWLITKFPGTIKRIFRKHFKYTL